jgi:hypothetical protein
MTNAQGDNMRSTRPSLKCQMGILFITVALGAFAAGYITADRRNRQMVFEEGRRQFIEFLKIGSQLDIITVHQDRLNELVIPVGMEEGGSGSLRGDASPRGGH